MSLVISDSLIRARFVQAAFCCLTALPSVVTFPDNRDLRAGAGAFAVLLTADVENTMPFAAGCACGR
ncbi:MAG: hypothetical protein EWM45_09350 [Rhodopseudomonas palustris]|nr:MAG: hypothetical protein EWM45_09350 [Rhodopseudomonas palustris]